MCFFMDGFLIIVLFEGPPGPELARGVATSLPAPPAAPPPACAIASVQLPAKNAAASSAVTLVAMGVSRVERSVLINSRSPPLVPR
jgi:hypothetical protein